jgi:hypoxia up-regulated 1
LERRAIENPVQHRYQEIKDFPDVLNNSQKWNFHTRMFLTEARQNLTEEEKTDSQGRYSREELDELEQTLREHETWLSEGVEHQRTVKHYEDPAIETKEMQERADVLEQHLKRLVQKKPPKRKPVSSSTSSAAESRPTNGGTQEDRGKDKPGHQEL